MEENKKPVALWKGIVGTVASAFVLLIVFAFFLVYFVIEKNSNIWVILGVLVAFVIGLASLIISIYNLNETIYYREQARTLEKTQTKQNKQGKSKLLHKLLSEGKITIEEYDELSK